MNQTGKFVCSCGRDMEDKPVHKCECGRVWLWKIRSGRYVFGGGGNESSFG